MSDDAELTDLEENEVMNLQSEPESKHQERQERQENAEARTKTKTKKRKHKEHKRSKPQSAKLLCTEALKHIEERARARWAFESGSEHDSVSVDARAESDGSAGLQVGVWLPSGSASCAQLESAVQAQRGVDLVWDADKDDFEGVSEEMLDSLLGLRCGVAARRISSQIELRPCMPRSLGSELVTALSGLEAFLNRWVSKTELKNVIRWTKLGDLHVACVRTALSCLAARTEMQGFRCVSAHMQELPGFRKHELLQDFHVACQAMDAVALRKASHVRLVSCGRTIYASIADSKSSSA
jgi:hypothetical protein